MTNIMKLMKQAQAMQKDMERLQEELAQKTVEFAAGGGAVKAVARGDGSLASIKIDRGVVSPDDVEMLEDTVLAAANGAIAKAKEMASEEMSRVTAGLSIPGLGMKR